MSRQTLGSQSKGKKKDSLAIYINWYTSEDGLLPRESPTKITVPCSALEQRDCILPKADKLSLLDEREFSLRVVLSESSRFNGSIYLTYQRDLFHNFHGLGGGSYRGSCQLRLKEGISGNGLSHWSAVSLKCQPHRWSTIGKIYENNYVWALSCGKTWI